MTKILNILKAIIPYILLKTHRAYAVDTWIYFPYEQAERTWHTIYAHAFLQDVVYCNRNNYKITYIYIFRK